MLLGCLSLLLGSQTAVANPSPKLAIIIDDLGYNLSLGKQTIDLPSTLTVAILPFTPHTLYLANYAQQQGKEVMLHAPMSNHQGYPLGKGGLHTAMDKTEFLHTLRRNLEQVPHIKGVNNHMGSLLTEQPQAMAWLMAELQQRQLYFVDSRTSAQTQALYQAQAIGLPSARRDVFLDDDKDPAKIRAELRRALEKARTQGRAIAIGHPYPATLSALQALPLLTAEYGVELVTASQLISASPVPAQAPKNPPKLRPLRHWDFCMAPPPSLWPSIWAPRDPFDYNPLIWEH